MEKKQPKKKKAWIQQERYLIKDKDGKIITKFRNKISARRFVIDKKSLLAGYCIFDIELGEIIE